MRSLPVLRALLPARRVFRGLVAAALIELQHRFRIRRFPAAGLSGGMFRWDGTKTGAGEKFLIPAPDQYRSFFSNRYSADSS